MDDSLEQFVSTSTGKTQKKSFMGHNLGQTAQNQA